MNLWDLNLRDLAYVVAVAEHQSFSKAAVACAVSQPALSKQIKALETQLGMTLFERNQRQVILTEAGAEFVAQATQVLDQAHHLLETTRSDVAPLTGPFKLGIIASACAYVMPLLLVPLSKQFPQLKLWIREGQTLPLIGALKQGRLDAVLAADTVDDDALQATPLYFEPFWLAAKKPFAGSSPVHVSSLVPSQLLVLEEGHCLKEQTLALCGLRDSESVQFQASSVETLLQMTALGLGVSVVPQLALPQGNVLASLLDVIAFDDRRIGRHMVLYSRKTYGDTPSILALAGLATAEISKALS